MALSPGTSSQSEGYSSKWLIWLVCREPLYIHCMFSNVRKLLVQMLIDLVVMTSMLLILHQSSIHVHVNSMC